MSHLIPVCDAASEADTFSQTEGLHRVAGALGDTTDEEEHAGSLEGGTGAAGTGERCHILPPPLHVLVALHGGQGGGLVTCEQNNNTGALESLCRELYF